MKKYFFKFYGEEFSYCSVLVRKRCNFAGWHWYVGGACCCHRHRWTKHSKLDH